MTVVLEPEKVEEKPTKLDTEMVHIVDARRSTPELLIALCGYRGRGLLPRSITVDCVVCAEIAYEMGWDGR